jgi:hypothetical protein
VLQEAAVNAAAKQTMGQEEDAYMLVANKSYKTEAGLRSRIIYNLLEHPSPDSEIQQETTGPRRRRLRAEGT